MERFVLSPLALENYGSCVVEDFVPYSKSRALISIGPDLRTLCAIVDVSYKFDKTLRLGDMEILRTGVYVRLGHLYHGNVIYSEGWEGLHQPFIHEGDIYYTDDAPNGKIFKNGKLFLDHWDGIAEISNPWIHEDQIWFEARYEWEEAPKGWSIYTADMQGKHIRLRCSGANPCIYEDTLYYGLWNGTSFDIVRH